MAKFTRTGKGRKLTPAEIAWIGLGTYILLADIALWRTEQDTMSIQFGKWLMESKQGRAACFLGTAGMVAHLFWGLPLPFQTKAKQIATYKKNGHKPSVDLGLVTEFPGVG